MTLLSARFHGMKLLHFKARGFISALKRGVVPPGIKSKEDVMKLGIDVYNEECRSIVQRRVDTIPYQYQADGHRAKTRWARHTTGSFAE